MKIDFVNRLFKLNQYLVQMEGGGAYQFLFDALTKKIETMRSIVEKERQRVKEAIMTWNSWERAHNVNLQDVVIWWRLCFLVFLS